MHQGAWTIQSSLTPPPSPLNGAIFPFLPEHLFFLFAPCWTIYRTRQLILLVKTPIIFKSLNVVFKQKTPRNVKRDNRRRENMSNVKRGNIFRQIKFKANSMI